MNSLANRNVTLDVARGTCIFLIVLSHTSFSYSYLFNFFYVQVFFFLSGIFLKPGMSMKDGLYKKVKNILYPYVFFAICSSVCVLLIGRSKIENIHIYDPDSFDNGPLWFLITLFTLNVIWMLLNKVSNIIVYFLIAGILFLICYFAGFHQINDYTDFTLAGISLPFLIAGNYYSKIDFFLKKYNIVLFFASILLCCMFIWGFDTHIGIRWIKLPSNILIYLGASLSGIAFILSLSMIVAKIPIITKVLSYWGRESLFILCIHWPLTRGVFDIFYNTNNQILIVSICIVICYTCSYIGSLLKRYIKIVF